MSPETENSPETKQSETDKIEEAIRQRIIAEQHAAAAQRAAQNPVPPSPDALRQTAPHKAFPPLHPPSKLAQWQSRGGILGGIATVLIALLKFAAPLLLLLGKLKFLLLGLKFLTFGKLFLTGGSMLLSIVLESLVFGWRFGIGIVMLIFLHECGHAFAAWQCGKKFSNMVFVPFMGAMVSHRGVSKSLAEDAYIGIMGPVAGTVAGTLCVGIYAITHQPFWLVLARFNFLMNLFNLIPTLPLDGGWIVPLFSPKILMITSVLILPIAFLNPMILLLAILSFGRAIQGWKADPKTQPFYRVSVGEKWRYGIAYVGLAAYLAVSTVLIHMYMIGSVKVPIQLA